MTYHIINTSVSGETSYLTGQLLVGNKMAFSTDIKQAWPIADYQTATMFALIVSHVLGETCLAFNNPRKR